MPLTAWSKKLGVSQGRVRPAGFTPTSGLYAFALGFDLPGNVESLLVGSPTSSVEVSQTGKFGTTKIVRFKGKIRPPADLPDDSGFVAALLINNVEVMSQAMRPGWTRTISDWGANVSKVSGDAALSGKLRLTGTTGAFYFVELPAFYLDDFTMDPSSSTPVILNRIPEPDETQVPLDALIQLDLADVGSSGIDLATVQVFVRGVLAFDGGAFQAGFDGPGFATSAPQADVRRVTIDPSPSGGFSSQELVTIHVLGSTVGGSDLDVTYSFTGLDMTAPQLVTARATGQKTIVVSFDEPVLQVDSAGAGDALNPANYEFSRLSFPAVSLRAVSVEAISSTGLLVTVQWPMTPGARYQITAKNVEDIHGNAVLAPFDSVIFNGFAPRVPAGRSFTLWSLMPSDLKKRDLETGGVFKRFLEALQEPIDLFVVDLDGFLDFLNPDQAREEWVDVMLQDQGVPASILAVLSGLSQKRKLLANWKTAIKRSGSAPGIEGLVRALLGIEVLVVPYDSLGMQLGVAQLGLNWILGASSAFELYAFDIEVVQALSDDQRRQIRALVEWIKTGWTHFVRLKEPSAPGAGVGRVRLGFSKLGLDWILN